MNQATAIPVSRAAEGPARIHAAPDLAKARFIRRRRSVRLGGLEVHFLWVANGRTEHRSPSLIGRLRRACETLVSLMLLTAIILAIGGLAVFDGLELTRRIRDGEIGMNRMLPIVMFTARTTRSLVERARDSGVNGVVAKPASVYSVYTALSRVATERTTFVELDHYFGPDRRRKKVEIDSVERRSGGGRSIRPHTIGQKI